VAKLSQTVTKPKLRSSLFKKSKTNCKKRHCTLIVVSPLCAPIHIIRNIWRGTCVAYLHVCCWNRQIQAWSLHVRWNGNL